MAIRATNLVLELEYAPEVNTLRVTNEILNIEYAPLLNTLRVTNLVLMIEYAPRTGRRQGPTVQQMS
jgi:hypothetical protein